MLKDSLNRANMIRANIFLLLLPGAPNGDKKSKQSPRQNPQKKQSALDLHCQGLFIR